TTPRPPDFQPRATTSAGRFTQPTNPPPRRSSSTPATEPAQLNAAARAVGGGLWACVVSGWGGVWCLGVGVAAHARRRGGVGGLDARAASSPRAGPRREQRSVRTPPLRQAEFDLRAWAAAEELYRHSRPAVGVIRLGVGGQQVDAAVGAPPLVVD